MATSERKYVSKLSKNRILIFGGSSGIGYCVAEAALEHGATVIISGSGSAKLVAAINKLKRTYPELAGNVQGYTCDLSQPQALEANVSAIFREACPDALSKLNHIVFCAGNAIKPMPIVDATADSFQSVSYVRLLGSAMVAKLAPKYLVPGPESSIILTSGTMGDKGYPGLAANSTYCVAREGLTRALAIELAPVRVNCVSPGAVHTPSLDTVPAEQREFMLAKLAKETLAGKMGRPEDLAEAYIYAMKDHFLTGSVIKSDGGRMLV
jgi:NAD(P)-dependent dehydrogenase (short-subunit alcohol dehydrogenase family)